MSRRKQVGSKNKPLEFFAMYWRDLDRDTSHLDPIQFTAYMRVLFAYYDNQGRLHERSVRRASDLTDEQWASSRDVLARFFRIDRDDMWRQGRADREIGKVHKTRQDNSKAGRASAEKRAANRAESNGRSTAVETTVQPQEDKSNGETASAVHTERAIALDLDRKQRENQRARERVAQTGLEVQALLDKLAQAQPLRLVEVAS